MDKKIENKKLPVYSLSVNECTNNSCDTTETNFISLVEMPAIEVDFIAFSKDSNKQAHAFKIKDSSKHMLCGPLMLADIPIYRRNDNTGDEYYVTFDSLAIENSVKNFAKKGYNLNINMEHETPVQDAYLMESWIVTDPKNDKSSAYGFKNITKGSWMGVVHITNEEVWDNYIKTGQLKGFSVEGIYAQSTQPVDYFVSNQITLSKEEDDLINELVSILLK